MIEMSIDGSLNDPPQRTGQNNLKLRRGLGIVLVTVIVRVVYGYQISNTVASS